MRPFEACPFCNGEFMFDWINDTRRCNNCGALFTWRIIREPSGVPIDLTFQLKKAESRIAELEAAQRWIPVSERLPDNWESVLTIDMSESTRGVVSAFYNPETLLWVSHFSDDLWVTHWMPSPELPIVYGKACEE